MISLVMGSLKKIQYDTSASYVSSMVASCIRQETTSNDKLDLILSSLLFPVKRCLEASLHMMFVGRVL